jgi:hypothetical protein
MAHEGLQGHAEHKTGTGNLLPDDPQAAIRNLVQRAKNPPAGSRTHINIKLEYSNRIHPLVSEAFKQAGVDVSGYTHVIDTSGIRHALKKHGSATTETPRGQLPITSVDLELLPQIVETPDYVSIGFLTKGTRNATVVYVKRLGDEIILVEEARVGRKQLAVTTMMKRRVR